MKVSERNVYTYLVNQQINQSFLGFNYLISAICIALEKPIPVCRLYQEVAEKHHTSDNRVERNIRNAIKSKKIKSGEFIAQAVNSLKFEEINNDTTVRAFPKETTIEAESRNPTYKYINRLFETSDIAVVKELLNSDEWIAIKVRNDDGVAVFALGKVTK